MSEYQVFSEDWLSEAGKQLPLGVARYLSESDECEFSPSDVWLDTGFFPRGECRFSLGLLDESISGQGDLRPTFYSLRLLQAMRWMLRVRQGDRRDPVSADLNTP